MADSCAQAGAAPPMQRQATGLLDSAAFEEALKAVDALETAGGALGLQVQAQRVGDMILEMVEQELADANDDEEGSTDTGEHSPIHAPSMMTSSSTASMVEGDLQSPPGCVESSSGFPADPDSSQESNPHTAIDLRDREKPSEAVTAAGAVAGTGEAHTAPSGVAATTTVQEVKPALKTNRSKESLTSSGHKTTFCERLLGCISRIAWRLLCEASLLVLLVPHLVLVSTQPRHRTLQIYELMLPLVVSLVAARVAVFSVYSFLELVQLYVSLPSRIILFLAALHGWPIIVLTQTALFTVLGLIPFVDERWAVLQRMSQFWQLAIWLGLCALTKAILEVSLQVTLNGLSVKHYGSRVETAVAMYSSIRKLFAVARASERAHRSNARSSRKARQAAVQNAAAEAAAQAVVTEDLQPQASSRFERLQEAADVLSGPLEFGAGFQDANSLEDAKRRARRAFLALVKAQGAGTDGMGLKRDQVLKWLDVRDNTPAANLFMVDPLKEDDLVAVVERAYKEQRFITASLSSFDVVNGLLRRFFIGAWAVAMIFIATFLFGVDFKEWVLPLITLSVSVCWVLSRILGDVLQGAIFVLWIRPFDIGDWVKLSAPGSKPQFDEMVVSKIGLWRTNFVSSTGESLLIQNSVMHGMCISNLNRSRDPCLPMKIQVPAATPPAKVTELVDGIRQYIADRDNEWSTASLSFANIDYSAGHMTLEIWATGRCLHQEFGALYGAKTRLLLFIHSYMQAAGIEYVRPVQPYVRKDMPAQPLPEAPWSM